MLRIGGLASGIDTDSMVKQLMKAENVKVDRVKQDRQIIEWKKQLYNELNKDFANFIIKSREKFEYSKLTGRPSGGNWAIKTKVSDENIATVKSSNAIEGNHSIDVKSLAEGVKGGSNKEIDYDTKIGSMKITINNKEITTDENSTIIDFVKKINDTEGIGVKATYDKANKRFFIQSTGVGKVDGGIKIEADAAGAKFLNEELDLRLSSGYDAGGNQKYENVNLGTNTSKIFEGRDAEIIYNGLTMTQNSNNFHLNGMNVSLKGTGTVTVNVGKDTEEAIKRIKEFVDEYNKIIDKVSGLIGEKANRNFRPLTEEQKEAMSEKEQELWQEKAKAGLVRNDSYLTNVLSNMRTDIYKNVLDDKGNKLSSFNHITQIGITTQEYKAGTAGGKLQIDEKKLREKLNEDFDGVMDLLFKEAPENAVADDSKLNAEKLSEKRNKSGIFTRIFDNMMVGMKELIHKAGTGKESDLFREVRSNMLVDFTTSGGKYSGKGSISDMDDELFKFDKKLDDLNALLFRKENAYYAKFTAMEKAMQRMSSQSGWLSQQLGGGGF